jgi:protein-S-isoprenylcysteine O-methyltransferase Ste14
MKLSILWNIVYWAWILSEVGLVVVTRTRRGKGDVRDRGSLLILWPTIFVSIWVALQYAATHPHTMLGGAHWLRWVGLGIFLVGFAIRWTAILSLGRSFSVNVAIQPTQTVYRRGLYRLVRHPSYTGMLLLFAGVGFETRNWISLAVMLIPTTAALFYRIHVEEAALLSAFGPAYGDYARSTRRLIPGIY